MLKALTDLLAGSLLVSAALVLITGILNHLVGWDLALKIGGSRIEVPDDIEGLVFVSILLSLMALFFWSVSRLRLIWEKVKSHPVATVTLAVCLSGGLSFGVQQALGGSLGFAVEVGDEAGVLSLLETESYPPEELSEYLYQALKNSHFAMAKGLIEKGADPNRVSGEQSTPMLTAAMSWFPDEAIDILLASGADANKLDSLGRTPAMCLILYRGGNFPECGGVELAVILTKLKEAGADFSIEAKNGDTVLSLAEKSKSAELMEVAR